jgi:predicted XRE-type DNA-binding protein
MVTENKPNQTVDSKLAAKKVLMTSISDWIKERNFTQSEAAGFFCVTNETIADIENKKTDSFILDTLLDMVYRTGKRVVMTFH